MINESDTIAAIATPPGIGALGIVRMSGKDAINIAQKMFASFSLDKNVKSYKGYTMHHGQINRINLQLSYSLQYRFFWRLWCGEYLMNTNRIRCVIIKNEIGKSTAGIDAKKFSHGVL